MTLPGRAILSHAMLSLAVNPRCFIMYRAIKVPVLPRPARQCTATAPGVPSQMRINRSTMSSEGVVQSVKKRSWCTNPASQYGFASSATAAGSQFYFQLAQSRSRASNTDCHYSRSGSASRVEGLATAPEPSILTFGVVETYDVCDVFLSKDVQIVARDLGKLARADPTSDICGPFECKKLALHDLCAPGVTRSVRPPNQVYLAQTSFQSHRAKRHLMHVAVDRLIIVEVCSE